VGGVTGPLTFDSESIYTESVSNLVKIADTTIASRSQKFTSKYLDLKKENYLQDLKVAIWHRTRSDFISASLFIFVGYLFYVYFLNTNLDPGVIVSSLYLLIIVSPIRESILYFQISHEKIEIINSIIKFRMSPKIKKASEYSNTFTSEIELKGLSVSGRALIDDLSITPQLGTINYINLPNGFGKSTFFKLLSGAYFDKEVMCEHLNFENTSVFHLLQETILYNTSILENILVGRKEVVKIDSFWPDIELLGLSHLDLSAGSHGLSGGEKSKVMLLRAAYSEKEIILLDEPENNLDAGSRKCFLDIILKNNPRAMLFVITHTQFDQFVETSCVGHECIDISKSFDNHPRKKWML